VFQEIERIRQMENDEKQKLRAQINNEKKLTEEVNFQYFQYNTKKILSFLLLKGCQEALSNRPGEETKEWRQER
jgi:hypothetical protein